MILAYTVRPYLKKPQTLRTPTNNVSNGFWCHLMPASSVLRRLEQEDCHGFDANLGYIWGSRLA